MTNALSSRDTRPDGHRRGGAEPDVEVDPVVPAGQVDGDRAALEQDEACGDHR